MEIFFLSVKQALNPTGNGFLQSSGAATNPRFMNYSDSDSLPQNLFVISPIILKVRL
ncbi:hypothetical protein [Dyadobacter sediminis]|uniref:hypothetical protein n=1 Tax=Dyadobacter sediminis TaxID=1493691 RepID=UPI001485CE7B|nr:hypothetical protein [Dyadobacter sediminis]